MYLHKVSTETFSAKMTLSVQSLFYQQNMLLLPGKVTLKNMFLLICIAIIIIIIITNELSVTRQQNQGIPIFIEFQICFKVMFT